MSKHRWIQKAVKTMRKDKPCTGSKFGSSSCPPGSKRYNLAKTFKAMAKKRKAEGGVVGNKISLLMKEGFKQPQALAIALDMQRRGKLQDGGKVQKDSSKYTLVNDKLIFNPLKNLSTEDLKNYRDQAAHDYVFANSKGKKELYLSELRYANTALKYKPLEIEKARREKFKEELSQKFKHGGKIPEWLYDARGKAMRRKMREQMRDGGLINKYPFGGAINKGVSSIATALGAKPENAQLWGSALSTLTGIIPGMQDNLLQGADLIGDVGTVTGQEELQQFGEFTRPIADITGMFTGDTGNILGKVPWKGRHGGDPRYAQFHNLSQEDYNKAVINVEKDELEVKGGKVLTDYKAKPRHPEDENEVDFYGNTLAKPGNIIIPRGKREAYLKGDKITRNTIEVQLQRDQNKREKGELSELRSRNQYLKSLSENVRRHISTTGKKPVEGTSPSIFPPGYSVGLKDLDLYRHGGDVNNLNAEDYSNLFYGQGGCVGCGYKHGGSVLPKYQGGGLTEKAPAYEDEFGYQNFLNSQLADYYGKSQAGYNVPQYSPAVSTAQTKFDPFYNPGTANFGINKPVQTQGNKFGFSDFAQYAAPAYNIGMGLFGKTPQAEAIQNPYTERVKDIMSRRRISMGPVYEGIGLASAGATRQLRGLTGGSAGLQLQGMQNIQNIEARNRANAAMQEQIANMGFRGEEATMLAGTLGPQEMTAAEKQRQLQYAMGAHQAQFIPKGLEQLSGLAQGRNRDTILRQELERRKQAAIASGNQEQIKYLTQLLG